MGENKDINTEKKEYKKTQNITTENMNEKLLNEIEIILPKYDNPKVTKNLINSFELSIYKKEIENMKLNINRYSSLQDLEIILEAKASPGKIFIGTLDSDSTKLVKKFCEKNILFFSFVSNNKYAKDCIYLVNFFPEDDLIAIFNYLPKDSRVALLFPENYYGYKINEIIDPIANNSKSLLINRASYKENLSDAREAIKELGKYELRKYELERQKQILKKKNDEVAIKALKKIEKFETLAEVEFTHLILPDYGIRLLEIAPLLPFYDVDPEKVQFVGTGVWDDSVFFDEPSLQGSIFSGIEETKRSEFFRDYLQIYKEQPLRTSTIPYDLVGLVSYLIEKNMSLNEAHNFINNSMIQFDGIDGKFSFLNHVIYRELDILQIKNGKVEKLN